MLKEKKKWERPQIRTLGELPEAMGNCVAGSTQTGGSCANGQSTPAPANHTCIVGGATKGLCLTGGGGKP